MSKDFMERFINKYDKYGKSISLLKWAKLLEDRNYRRVGLFTSKEITISTVRSSKEITISTVWLGIDHNFSCVGKKLIFETMVFGNNIIKGWEIKRYSTLSEAKRGHKQFVEKYTKEK